MLGRLNRVMMLMAIVLSIASPALAHTPPPSIASELDLRNVDAVEEIEIVEPLPIIPASTFDDVARIQLPHPSIVEMLEQRTTAMLAHADARTHQLFASDSAELASWPLASGDENNINGERKLSLELHRATEFQALPFSEPATGLIYARARWYDPSTGSFLTPDPLGYVDSSNLYAFAGGDPINGRDPRGEHTKRTINVNGMPVVLDVPTIEEMNEGDFSLGVSYTPTGSERAVHHLFDRGQGADLFLLAKINAPTARATFEQFYGVSIDQVDYSVPAAWWQSVKTNAPNIALATLGSIALRAPSPARPSTSTPRVNMVAPRPSAPAPVVKPPYPETKRNYAKNFRAVSDTPDTHQVHHTLFQKYEAEFAARGVNIHEMRFLRGVDPKVHSRITTATAKLERELGRRLTVDEVLDLAIKTDQQLGTQLSKRLKPQSGQQ